MHHLARPCVALLLAGALGCGSSGTVAVTGTVKLNGEPLPGAVVTFYPEGGTKGLGGHGTTGPDGKYTLTSARGGQGVLPGAYRVVVSRFLNPDGSAPDPKVPRMEGKARETLPGRYSDRDATELRATVSKDAPAHDFALKADGKGR
jgi:hypothetical protein